MGIEPTTSLSVCLFYNHTLYLCATTGLNISSMLYYYTIISVLFLLFFKKRYLNTLYKLIKHCILFNNFSTHWIRKLHTVLNSAISLSTYRFLSFDNLLCPDYPVQSNTVERASTTSNFCQRFYGYCFRFYTILLILINF